MRDRRHVTEKPARVASLALVLASLAFIPPVWAESDGAAPAAPALATPAVARINVSFKLDPRLSGPTYGGERWVSPPTYTGAAAQETIHARGEGVNARGQPVRISPTWTASDPGMVEVAPSEGSVVRITVKHPGESTLEVAAQGVSRELLIKAENRNGSLLVQISQQP